MRQAGGEGSDDIHERDDAAAAALIAAVEARARRVDTPCGDGTMAWRIWGEEQGRRPPLVLVHGAHGSWQHWIRNIDALAEQYTVIVADLPGHGDSALPETPDHPGIAKALAAGLRAMPGDILGDGLPVTAVGFSFGAVVLAWLAALHPGVLSRAILIGCGGLDTPHGPVDIQKVSGLVGHERRARMKANLLGLMLHDPDSVDALALHMLIPNARRARLAVKGLVMPDMLIKVLARVEIPVDAIWGEFDRPHPDPGLQEAVLRKFKPDCDFRVIAGAGHWTMYERAETCNAVLLDMLAHPRR